MAKKRRTEGNPLEEARVFVNELWRRAQDAQTLTWAYQQAKERGDPVVPYRVSLKLPQEPGDDVLCVLSGRAVDGTRKVAFVSGDTILAALRAAYHKWRTKSLRWRDDRYVANRARQLEPPV